MGLTLRDGNREYFYNQLDRLFPGIKEQYITVYGNKYVLNSPNGNQLMKLFHRICEENCIIHSNKQKFQYINTYEDKRNNLQLSLFD